MNNLSDYLHECYSSLTLHSWDTYWQVFLYLLIKTLKYVNTQLLTMTYENWPNHHFVHFLIFLLLIQLNSFTTKLAEVYSNTLWSMYNPRPADSFVGTFGTSILCSSCTSMHISGLISWHGTRSQPATRAHWVTCQCQKAINGHVSTTHT